MPRVCQITGKRTQVGRSIARRGLPKKKKGVGLKTTGITRRQFRPNLQYRRIWVPELNKFVRIRLCKKALKMIDKSGAYTVLQDAGVVKPQNLSRKKSKKEAKG